jgi:ribosome modulation factor
MLVATALRVRISCGRLPTTQQHNLAPFDSLRTKFDRSQQGRLTPTHGRAGAHTLNSHRICPYRHLNVDSQTKQ